jgi:hypothetical protein
MTTTRLSTLEQSYAALNHYEDTGRMRFTLPLTSAEPDVVCCFKTWFARPDLQLRLRWLSPFTSSDVIELRRSVLTTRGSSFARLSPCTSLEHAIATLTGVSFGAARLVPSLLLPGIAAPHPLWHAERESARDLGDAIEMADTQVGDGP